MPRVCVIVAVRAELAPFARILEPGRGLPPIPRHYPALAGSLGGIQILVLAGGVGSTRSAEAAGEVIHEWRPDWLIAGGAGGGLQPGLEIGVLVAADTVHHPSGERFEPSGPVCDADGVRVGAMYCSDRVMITADEKRRAGREHDPGALVVEMETAGIARECIRRQVRWSALRGISDRVEDSLPLDFNRLRDPDGDLPTGRVALSAMAQPSSIPGLIRLGQGAGLAARAVASAMRHWIPTAGATLE